MDLQNDPNAFEILMHVTGHGGDIAEMDSGRIVRQIFKATGVTTTGMKRANQGQEDSIE